MTSRSQNDLSVVTVRRAGGQKLQAVLDRVRIRIDGLTDLPDTARRPVIEASGFDFPALYLNLYGETDPATLQSLAQRLKEELLAQPELSRLQIWGLIPRELRIEIDPVLLRHYGLTVADVTRAIEGKLAVISRQVVCGPRVARSICGPMTGRNMRLNTRPCRSSSATTAPLCLWAILPSIEDGFQDGEYLFRLNGKPTVGMEVLVGQKENLLDDQRCSAQHGRRIQPPVAIAGSGRGLGRQRRLYLGPA